jgi:hypothetical protein
VQRDSYQGMLSGIPSGIPRPLKTHLCSNDLGSNDLGSNDLGSNDLGSNDLAFACCPHLSDSVETRSARLKPRPDTNLRSNKICFPIPLFHNLFGNRLLRIRI